MSYRSKSFLWSLIPYYVASFKLFGLFVHYQIHFPGSNASSSDVANIFISYPYSAYSYTNKMFFKWTRNDFLQSRKPLLKYQQHETTMIEGAVPFSNHFIATYARGTRLTEILWKQVQLVMCGRGNKRNAIRKKKKRLKYGNYQFKYI